MRSISRGVFLIFLLAPLDLQGACEAIRWGDREAVSTLAADGDTLWIGGTSALESWDVSEPLRPRRTQRHETGPVAAVAVADHGLIALAQGRLLTIGASGVIADLPSSSTHIAASGSEFVTATDDTVTLWRLDAMHPTAIATATTGGGIRGIAFAGATVVAARGDKGIVAWDVASGMLVRPRSGAVAAQDVVIAGTNGWAAAGSSGLIRFDPATLAVEAGGAIDAGAGTFNSITHTGDRLFVGDASGFVRVYRIDDEGASADGIIPFPVIHVAANDAAVMLAGRARSRFGEPLPAVDRVMILDLETLRQAGSIPGASVSLTGAAPFGNLVYVADPPVMRTLSIAGATLHEIATTYYGDASDTIRIEGGYAIVYGRGDAHLISLENPRSPLYLGVFRGLGTSPNDVAMAGDLLLEVNRGSGFHILDISDPTRPGQIGGMINDGFGQFHKIAATPEAAYGASDAVVKVIDLRDLSKVADPWTSRYTTTLPHGGVVDLETIPGEIPLLAIADGQSIAIYSLEDPVDPTLRSTTQIGLIRALRRVAGARAVVVAMEDGRVLEIELASASQPRVKVVDEHLPSFDVRANEDWLVASTGSSIVVLPRNETIAIAPLEAERAADGLILVRWPGRDQWLVSFSEHDDMRDATTFGIGGEAAVINGERAWRWVRATVAGCENLIAVASIAPSASAVIPLQTKVRLTGRSGNTVTADLAILNAGDSLSTVELLSPDASLTINPTTLTLEDGEHGSVEISATIPSTARELSLAVGTTEVIVLLEPVVTTAAVQGDFDLIVPGVGNTAGARGTRWRSNLDLACTSASACDVTLTWIRPSDPRALSLTLDAGEAMVIDDVASLFGVEGTGAIGIEVRGGARVEAGAVTWNDSPDGFYGQRIEAMRMDVAARSKRWIVPALASGDDFRTNLGVSAPLRDARATIVIRDGSGEVLARDTYELPRGAVRSIPLAVAGSSLVAEVQGEGIVVWASRVDQHTGDATFVAATPLSPQADQLVNGTWRHRIDLAGRTRGAGGAFWQTDLILTNPHEEPVNVRARWLPASGEPEERSITIPPFGSTHELESLLPMEGLGSFVLESDAIVVPWGRAWLQFGAGTFGQFMPSGSEPGSLPLPSATARRTLLFPAIQNERFRTNLAVAERSGVPTLAVISVRAPDGTLLTARGVEVGAWQTRQLNSVLDSWQIATDAGQIRIESRGALRSLISVVANSTGDGVTVATD